MPTIQKIKKRNGDIAEFEVKKIIIALEKAFKSVNAPYEETTIQKLTDQAIQEIEAEFQELTPSVEDVQDIVENQIMKGGFYTVAKAYILHRHEHYKVRERQHKTVLKKIKTHKLNITKHDGSTEVFSIEKLKNSIAWAADGYDEIIDLNKIATKCQDNLFDGISTDKIAKAVILSARSYIEKDPAYSHFAARLLNNIIAEENIGKDKFDHNKLDQQYRQAFIDNITHAIEIKRLSPKLLDYDLEKMAAALVLERDDLFRYLGLQTLYARYFIRNPENNRILETPQAFLMRVAMGLAMEE